MHEEHEAKIRKIRNFLADGYYQGILLSRRDSFAWLTCGGDCSVFKYTEQGNADVLITLDRKYVFLSEVETYRIQDEEINGLGFDIIAYDWYEDREKFIQKFIAGRKIVSDTGALRLPNVFFDFRVLRYSLLPAEAARFEELCITTAETLGQVCGELRIGDSEYEIAANLKGKLLCKGIEAPVCLIALDERIKKYRHPIPGENRLKKYALVVVGSENHGLFASVSRMVSFGKPSEEIVKKHKACMDVDAKMIAQTRVGANVSDILKTGVEAYAANGYPNEWRFHHQGGPTGYHAREFLATFGTNEKVLLNQAYAWNPTIAGTKCEDTYIVTEQGPDILTRAEGWPVVGIQTDSGVIKRPDILVK